MVRRIVKGQQNFKSSSGVGISKNFLEEYGNDNSLDKSTVADLAKGFVNAQKSVTNNSSNDQTILELLEKVSKQLESLQTNQNGDKNNDNKQQSSQQSQQQTKQGQEQNASSQQEGRIDNEALQDLFGKVLLNSYKGSNKTSNPSNNSSSNNKNANNETPALAVRTASQVLAKAQYELANELETSLQKLKQVISESEKIANQISNLLGESSSNKS